MGRLRKDYSLYRRRCKDGKRIWYYRTYDQYGERTAGCTTGETNRTRAERYCNRLLRTGELVPIKETGFEAYAKDWWVWGKCNYCRGRLARSPAGQPTISERHAAEMRSVLENHILPRFRASRLSSIRPQVIESWMFDLLDRGLSPKRINNIAGCLRVMLGEAKRLGLLQANPFDQVRMFAGRGRDRGTFSIEEIRTLFGSDSLEKIWNGHQLHRAINELAAATGLRQGEILAIRDEDIHDDHIHVSHSWHWRYGLLPTKTRQERDVPVPARVLEDIAFFVGSGGHVFSMNRGETPASGSRVTQALYNALERAGITPEERKRLLFTSSL
jgi:site-specific recombinase XerD